MRIGRIIKRYLAIACCIFFAQEIAALNNQLTIPSGAIQSGSYNNVVTYTFNYQATLQQEANLRVNVAYDETALELITASDLLFTSGGFFNNRSGNGTGPIDYWYTTQSFSVQQNNLLQAAQFSISFRIISPTCTPIAPNMNSITVSLLCEGNGVLADVQQVTANAGITVVNTNPAVSAQLIEGADCSGFALYKVTTFGHDNGSAPADNSQVTVSLPAGVTLVNVFNQTGSSIWGNVLQTGNSWSWYRAGNPAPAFHQQFFYLVLSFNTSIMCASPQGVNNMTVQFSSRNACNPGNLLTTNMQKTFNCCNNNNPPSPGGGSGVPSSSTIHVTDGIVTINKSLIAQPFRYMPAPNNACGLHRYRITVTNASPHDLQNFRISDFLGEIEPTIAGIGEIQITGVTASMQAIFPLGNSIATYQVQTNPFPIVGGVTLTNNNTPQTIVNAANAAALNVLPTLNEWRVEGVAGNGNLFPKFSRITIEIEHRLNTDNPNSNQYVNRAKLRFKNPVANNFLETEAGITSIHQTPVPAISIEKRVRRVSPLSTWASSMNAVFNEQFQFRIRIFNNGMASVQNAQLSDLWTDAANNFTLPTGVVVTGSAGYSPAELSNIQTMLSAAFMNGNNPSSITIPEIKGVVAPGCNNTELNLLFTVVVKNANEAFCNNTYNNLATLNYVFNGNTITIQDNASIQTNFFNGITAALEARCLPNGAWVTGNNFNAVPGQTVQYRAKVQNSFNFPLTNMRMMVQLPNATDNSSNHFNTTNYLLSSVPQNPPGTALIPQNITANPAGLARRNDALDNWLSSLITAPANQPSGNTAFYKTIASISANSTASITWDVTIPVNAPGSQYTTSLGIARVGANCALDLRTTLTTNIVLSNDCNTNNNPTSCDSILFNQGVEKIANNQYRITLSSLFSIPGNSFQPDNFDIVVHQPYRNCIIAANSANYVMPVYNYTLGAITQTGLPAFTIPPPLPGQRYYNVYNGINNLSFQNISFIINLGNAIGNCNFGSPASGMIVFPLNIVFRDKAKCVLCEKRVLLQIPVLQTQPN